MFAGALIQFSITSVLLSWKPAQVGLYKIAAPLLLLLSLYFFLRSTSTLRSIEEKRSGMIVKGLEFEESTKGSLFFHEIMNSFSLKQVLFSRLIIDLLCFSILGYLTYQFLAEVVPSFSIPKELLMILISSGLSIFSCRECYVAIKPLADKKRFIKAQNEEESLPSLSDAETHRAQAIEYKKLAATFKQNNFKGLFEMFASLAPLYYLSKREIPYVKPLSCLLGLFAVYLIARDFMRSKELDEKIVRLVIKGIDLERKKSSFDRFFHNVLNEFSIVRILVSRSLSTVLCVYYLSFSMNRILFGSETVAGEPKILLGLIGTLFGAITCYLYYRSYKELEDLKSASD